MKFLFVLGAVFVACSQAYVEDMTPYRSVIGTRGGAPRPPASALARAVPAGFHVQVSHAREAYQKTIPYNYGAPVRSEDLMATARAPLVLQPEVAFMPIAASAAPPTADSLPVYSNAPIPTPAKSTFASFAELEAAADAEAEANADSASAATVGSMSASKLDAEIDTAADFAAELEMVLENGDKAALEREQQERNYALMRGGKTPEQGQEQDEELYSIHQAAFLEAEAEVEVDAEAAAAAEMDAELDAEVDEDLDLEAEAEHEADAEAEAETEVDAEAEFESEFDA